MPEKNKMKDFDAIWRIQDEIRTVVNAVLGECIWNLSYDERRRAIVLELTLTLDEDTVSDLCCQFPITADYDGCGPKGTRFTFYKKGFICLSYLCTRKLMEVWLRG